MLRAWFLFVVALASSSVEAKTSIGNVFDVMHQWKLLDSFVFKACPDPCTDLPQVTIRAHEFNQSAVGVGQRILFYHDVPGEGFPGLLDGDLASQSCRFKQSRAAESILIADIPEEGKIWRPKNAIPRTWYMVVANCDPQDPAGDLDRHYEEGVRVEYEIQWWNGEGKFTRHFGEDMRGIFESCIVFFFVLSSFIVVFALAVFFLWKQSGIETSAAKICIMVTACVGSHWMGNCMMMAHLDAYSADGIGLPHVKAAALTFEQLPELGLVCLFLFLAKGVFVSAPEVQDSRGVLEIMGIYTATTMIMLYWQFEEKPQTEDQEYIMATAPGGVLIGARVITMLIFMSMMFNTYTNEPLQGKRRFYFQFGILATLWFMTMPAAAIIASSVYDYHLVKVEFMCGNIFDMITYLWLYLGFTRVWVEVLKTDPKGAGGHSAINQNDDNEDFDDEVTM